MRYLVAIVLALGLWMSPAAADERHVVHAFDTGPFACGSGGRDLWLVNPVGREIRIKATTLWLGMSTRGVADYNAILYAYDRGTNQLRLIQVVGWDHYAEPTAPGGIRQTFGGDWVTLGAGHYLRLVASCREFLPGVVGHVSAFIEYGE